MMKQRLWLHTHTATICQLSYVIFYNQSIQQKLLTENNFYLLRTSLYTPCKLMRFHVIRTRSRAVAKITDRTGCQWPSRSSKVDDFHVIWKPICHFLLVINSNLGRISHRFRDIKQIFYPLSFNPKFENVPLAVDCWNFASPSFTHMPNYACK